MSRPRVRARSNNKGGEIILRPEGFCNLSEIVVRSYDSLEDLKKKARAATIIGTFQSTLTDFKYLNPNWKKNAEEERLLGVSLTGEMDHPILSDPYNPEIIHWLQELKAVTIETNIEFAKKLGIPVSAAITTVKPSGTVSQLVDSASGMHARHSPYYLRAVRNDVKDPLSRVMIESGIPYEQDLYNPSNYVFYFPIKSPEGSITRNELSAIRQLDIWLIYKTYWCEHNPSVTISVGDDEWLDVGAWVYKNFDNVGGLSFLPRSNHTYQQAPYQEITEDEYFKWLEKMPKNINWDLLAELENEDYTTAVSELACVSGYCEI